MSALTREHRDLARDIATKTWFSMEALRSGANTTQLSAVRAKVAYKLARAGAPVSAIAEVLGPHAAEAIARAARMEIRREVRP